MSFGKATEIVKDQQKISSQSDLHDTSDRISNNTNSHSEIHNDKHIFFLKAVQGLTEDQGIFSFCGIPRDKKQRRSQIRIKSRQSLRDSLNLIPTLVKKYSEADYYAADFQASSRVNRFNKKVELIRSQQSLTKISGLQTKKYVLESQKTKANNFGEEESGLVYKKSLTNKKSRNYFNVKQFLQETERRKHEDAVILMNNTSKNFRSSKEKSMYKLKFPTEKIKKLQFNAIQITKNIVQKSQSPEKKMSYDLSKGLLNQNKSYFQGAQIDPRSGGKQQKPSLWRSKSYQIPMMKSSSKKFNIFQKMQNSAECERYDLLSGLKPWNDENERVLLNRKQCQIERNILEEQNDYFNTYMKTTRLKCQPN